MTQKPQKGNTTNKNTKKQDDTKTSTKSATKSIYFSNIPRRKMYEEMLDFEDGLMELEILQYNEENFVKFKEVYNEKSFKKMSSSFVNIKAVLIMFLENRKYKTEAEHKKDIKVLIDNQKNTNTHIRKNKNITIKQKYLFAKLNYIFDKHDMVKDVKHAKSAYKSFVKFNDEIPKILELRRDQMR